MSYQFSKYETHYRNLTYLGVPIIIGQLGNLILNFADTLMIGHHSTEELADFYKLDEYYFKFAYLLTHKAPNIGLIQVNQTQLSFLFLADKKKTHFLTILTLVSIVKELSEENKLALRDALLTFDKNFLTKDRDKSKSVYRIK